MEVIFKTLNPCSRITLPMELILSCILPKLPAKSLFRFKCVSKSFLTEISSPKFNELFSEANHRLLILPGQNDDDDSFSIYELDSLHSPPTFCPYPIPSQWFAPAMAVVACCESYLLIGCHEGLILVNPSTRIYRVLPLVYIPTYSDYVRYGMCHCLDDEFNNDFKIVTIFQYNKGHYDIVDIVWEVVVFSLSTNSWKTVKCKRNRPTWIDDPVLVQNHLLVMILYDGSHYGRKMKIGCFDIKAERWSNDVLLPDILLCEIETNPARNFLDDYYHLGVLDGRLRFSCYDMNKSTYSIWVMKDYGVKESWFELMSVPRQDVCHPIVYRKGLSHELLCIPKYRGKYFWYNIREKQFIETGIDGDGFDTSDFSFAYICKQSLLNFPGGLPIPSLSKEDHDDDYEEDEEENDEYLLSSCKF